MSQGKTKNCFLELNSRTRNAQLVFLIHYYITLLQHSSSSEFLN